MIDSHISKAREKALLEEMFETVRFDVESEGIPLDPDGDGYPEDNEEDTVMNTFSAVRRAQEIQDALGTKAHARMYGLTLFSREVKALEGIEMMLELKVRRVRTPAGVARFKQPIGSIIVKDRLLTNLKINAPKYDGWDHVTGANGKSYDVGKVEGEYHAYGEDDWDDLVASAKTEDELFVKLDGLSAKGGKKAPAAKPGTAAPKKVAKVSKAKRDDFVWNETTYPQWDQYEALDEAQKDAYYKARQDGRPHRGAITEARGAKKPSRVERGADDISAFLKENLKGTYSIGVATALIKEATTDEQFAEYNALDTDGKSNYHRARRTGKNHKQGMDSAKPAKKPAASPKNEDPGDDYEMELEAAMKLATPAQAKQLKKFLKNEQMVKDYIAARKNKRSHAQAVGDAIDADIARAKGKGSADPKAPAGQGTLF